MGRVMILVSCDASVGQRLTESAVSLNPDTPVDIFFADTAEEAFGRYREDPEGVIGVICGSVPESQTRWLRDEMRKLGYKKSFFGQACGSLQ